MSKSKHYLEAPTALADDIILHKEAGFTKEQTMQAMDIAFCRSWQIQCRDPLLRGDEPDEELGPIRIARKKAIAALWDYWVALGGAGANEA